MIVKIIVKMCFLVQETEENVNMINNHTRIMHKSAYLQAYFEKENLKYGKYEISLAVPTFGLKQFLSIFN